jgi:putative NADPH-quinone reductase
VQRIEVAKLDFPLLRTKEDWEKGEPPAAIRASQQTIAWAGHLAIFFPLRLGDVPALFKAFLEQTLRPGFALTLEPPSGARNCSRESRRASSLPCACRRSSVVGTPAPTA